MAAIENDWLDVIKPEFKKPYYKDLFEKVKEEYHNYEVFPPSEEIFNAFHLTPYSKVKEIGRASCRERV